ncbi:MAG: hypothetical protein Q7S00_02560, partial [bacterium]|nr:hypothetical protein [bacterium]
KKHPWFLGCQFHPEFKSRPHNPQSLFVDFIKASVAYQGLKSWQSSKEEKKSSREAVGVRPSAQKKKGRIARTSIS